jgi:hypothetical protein
VLVVAARLPPAIASAANAPKMDRFNMGCFPVMTPHPESQSTTGS